MKNRQLFGLALALGITGAAVSGTAEQLPNSSAAPRILAAYPVFKEFPWLLHKLEGGAPPRFSVVRDCQSGYGGVCRNGNQASSACGCGWIGYSCICDGVFGWWSAN